MPPCSTIVAGLHFIQYMTIDVRPAWSGIEGLELSLAVIRF